MHISWLGQSAFKIEFKNSSSDGVLLIDPYKHAKEETPRNLSADLAVVTHGEDDLITLTKEPFIVAEPGEYEYKEVLMYGFQTAPIKNAPLIFRMEIEHMTVAHIGMLQVPLEEKLVNELNGVDILMIPVGGGSVLSAERAAELITKIEPRVVIPYAFKAADTGAEFADITGFKKSIGLDSEVLPKLKIAKKDLPSDQMMLVLLEKQ